MIEDDYVDIELPEETIKMIEKVRKHLSYDNGRDFSFNDTLDYVIDNFIEEENIIEQLHNAKKTGSDKELIKIYDEWRKSGN